MPQNSKTNWRMATCDACNKTKCTLIFDQSSQGYPHTCPQHGDLHGFADWKLTELDPIYKIYIQTELIEKLKITFPKFDSTVNIYHRKNAAWQRHNTKLQEARHNLKKLI